MNFLSAIVKGAGRGFQGVGHLASEGTHAIASTAGKVPVIGKPLKSVVNLSYSTVNLASSILEGQRIDHAVMNNLKQQVNDVKEVAPYAQMVISFVPGIGTSISGGLAAGIALANGQPITTAIRAGVEGALPGGPAAKMAFNASAAVIDGKSLDKIAFAAIPLPDEQKKALQTVAVAARDLAKGVRVDKVALAAAEKSLPNEIKTAVNTGVAIAHGANLQKTIIKNVAPAALDKLRAAGDDVLATNPTLRAGSSILKDAHAKAGFSVGAALSRFQLSPIEVVATRGKMTGAQKKGFDLALAAHIGGTLSTAPAKIANDPAALFAFRATVGAKTLTAPNQTALVRTLAANAATRSGVALAVEVRPIGASTKPGFWKRVLIALGLSK